MKRIISMLLAALLVFSLAACGTTENPIPTNPPGKNGPSKPTSQEPQIVDDPYSGYCGNTTTTIPLDDKNYLFTGSDSVTLTDILLNLKYSPRRVCRCAPEFEVTTEFGGPYGVNLSEAYARCEDGQADLTAEQVARIRQILENQT